MRDDLPLNLTLEKQEEGETGQFEIVINVENPLDCAVNALNVMWRFDYDDPLDERVQKMNKVAEFVQLGQGPLLSRETRQFVYPSDGLSALLSVVDALSPERYSIVISFDGTTETAFDGPTFGTWVQREFG